MNITLKIKLTTKASFIITAKTKKNYQILHCSYYKLSNVHITIWVRATINFETKIIMILSLKIQCSRNRELIVLNFQFSFTK